MLGIEEIKHLLTEVRGMRHDLNKHLGDLVEEVKKVNKNLVTIEEQNKERFAQRRAALKAELKSEPEERDAHKPRHHH